jgi:hypothetical protein
MNYNEGGFVLYYESLQGQIRIVHFDARRLADPHLAIVIAKTRFCVFCGIIDHCPLVFEYFA